MLGPPCKLFRFDSEHGTLNGALYDAGEGAPVVLHIHGSLGNFYKEAFVPVLGQRLVAAGWSLAAINVSNHDALAEGDQAGKAVYVGGSATPFSWATQDIQAAISYLQGEGRTVAVLSGHSFGCDRVVQYLLAQQSSLPCVLLAPCDSFQLGEGWWGVGEVPSVLEQLRGITQDGWLPDDFYGVRAGGDWTYSIPIRRDALLSIMEGAPYRLFRYSSSPGEWKASGDCLLVTGSEDVLLGAPHDSIADYMRDRFTSTQDVEIVGADHCFAAREQQLAASVVSWVQGKRKETDVLAPLPPLATTGWEEQEYLAAVQAGVAQPRPAQLGVVPEGASKVVRRWFGLNIHVENPAGSIREWPGGHTNMLYDYGEIKGTDGADGDPVDVYVGPHPATAPAVHVVHQLKAPDFMVYDEAKCFIGFKTAGDAKKAYEAHYTNPAFFGGMESFPVGEFVQYIKDHGTSPGKPPVTFWDLWNSTKGLL